MSRNGYRRWVVSFVASTAGADSLLEGLSVGANCYQSTLCWGYLASAQPAYPSNPTCFADQRGRMAQNLLYLLCAN